jgi:hypothetical protein
MTTNSVKVFNVWVEGCITPNGKVIKAAKLATLEAESFDAAVRILVERDPRVFYKAPLR